MRNTPLNGVICMKNRIYGIICVFLVLLSHRADAMDYRQAPNLYPPYMINKNIYMNYRHYEAAIHSRFNQNRQCYWLTPYAETAADFIPLLGATLVPTRLTNRLVGIIPFLDISTKNKVASSLNRALVANLAMAVFDVAKPAKERIRNYRIINEHEAGNNENSARTRSTGKEYKAIRLPPYNMHSGKPLRSPVATNALFISTYAALDLAAQSETVAETLNAIPGVQKTSQFLNKHVSVRPGTSAALVQFSIFALAAYCRSRV
jgi:hypothetical protein